MVLICSIPFIILIYVVLKNIRASKQDKQTPKESSDLSTTRRNSVSKRFLSNSTNGEKSQNDAEKDKRAKRKQQLKKAAKVTLKLVATFIKKVIKLVIAMMTVLASLGVVAVVVVLIIVILLTVVIYMFFLTDEGFDFGFAPLKEYINTQQQQNDPNNISTQGLNGALVTGDIGTYSFAPSDDTKKILGLSDEATWQLISDGRFSSYNEANQAVKDELAEKGLEFTDDNLKLTDEYNFWNGQLVSITVPAWEYTDGSMGAKKSTTVTVQVNKALSQYFTDFLTDLYNCSNQYVIQEIGGYNFRGKNTASGYSPNLSGHSFGATLDINWSTEGMCLGDAPFQYTFNLEEPVKSRACAVESPWNSLVRMYELDWGGNWSSGSLDPMHFSLVGDNPRANRNYTPKVELRNIIDDYVGANFGSSVNANIILVGDSRTVGIASAKGASSSSSSVEGTISDSNVYVKGQVSMGASYLKDECIPYIESVMSNAEGSTWFVTSWFGVNDLGNADKYMEIYDELLSHHKNMYLFIGTVGNVDESKISGNYTVTNAAISDFNEKMKSHYSTNPHVVIVDIYSNQMSEGFNYYSDGLHYSNAGYDYVFEKFKTAWSSKGSAVVPKYADGGYYEGEIIRGEGSVLLRLPHLCQLDYNEKRGSSESTIANSGCIDTSVTMILSFLTHTNIDVHNISAYCGSDNCLNTSGVLASYGYGYIQRNDINEAMKQIDNGYPCLLKMHGPWYGVDGTCWHKTSHDHWIVMCGYDEFGYFVEDPARHEGPIHISYDDWNRCPFQYLRTLV